MAQHPAPARSTAVSVLLIAMVAAVVLWPGATFHQSRVGTPGSPGSVVDTDPLTASAQSQLDQVFGVGHSRIAASATYAAASDTVSKTYDPRGSAPLAAASATGPGYRASSVQRGVGQTVTQTRSPGGAITRLSVAVVVDASRRPDLRAVRRTVSAAMGLVPARGDRLSVVSAPMAVPVTSSAPTPSIGPSWTARVAAYVPSGTAVIIALGGVVALLAPRRATLNET